MNTTRTTWRHEGVALRRTLVTVATMLGLAAAAHLADHAIRGEIVTDHRLDEQWNHSGWPFTRSFTPFTVSLTIPVVFLVAAVLTARGRLGARFWMVWTAVAAAVLVFVHFVPTGRTETLGVIYRTYDRGVDNPWAGAVAAAGVVLLVAGLALLLRLAAKARRLPEE